MKQLEQNFERHGDDAHVQAGDREHVRESGGGVAIANLGREIAHVGDEERFGERRVGREHALDRRARMSAPTVTPCGPVDDRDSHVVHDEAALRRREVPTYHHRASRGRAPCLDRETNDDRTTHRPGTNEGAGHSSLVDDRPVNALPHHLLLAVCVGDARSGGNQRSSRDGGSA